MDLVEPLFRFILENNSRFVIESSMPSNLGLENLYLVDDNNIYIFSKDHCYMR